jgi:DASH complex subunit Ask1
MSTTDFERLERLEQAITLCLQEIDHNFIRCHRVATACLPVVERYAEQSRQVWQGAKVPLIPFMLTNSVLETIL